MSEFTKAYFDQNMDERIILGRAGYRKVLKPLIESLPKKARILDVGCGIGTYLKDIHSWRKDIVLYGIDVVDLKLPKYTHFKKAGAEKLPFKKGYFDLVFCFHVLEHLNNPYPAMREMQRVLRRGGVAYVEVPYYKTACIPDGSMNFWSDPTHVRPYNKISLTRLFRENGFKTTNTSVLRNWLSVFIGPYLILKRIFLNDEDALSVFCAHVVGDVVICTGVKP